MNNKLWTVKEAAPFLQVSAWLLYDMVRKKQVPHIKVRSKVFFRQEALEAWMLEQEASSMIPPSAEVFSNAQPNVANFRGH